MIWDQEEYEQQLYWHQVDAANRNQNQGDNMTSAELIKALQPHPPEAYVLGWCEEAGILYGISRVDSNGGCVQLTIPCSPSAGEPRHTLNLKGRLAAAQAEVEILRDQIKEEREAPHYQVDRLGPFVRVEVRLPHDSERFPSMLHGFSCTPRDWDAMCAGDIGCVYIDVMGPVLAEDPHFAEIRDKVEPLLLKEFGPRTTEGRADYKEPVEITPAKFNQYRLIQRWGGCNMLDYKTISQMTSLTAEEHREIIANYERYYETFSTKEPTNES